MPIRNGFKVVVMGNGHKVAAYLYAQPCSGGTRALGKVLFLDCQNGKCWKKHPRLVSHSSCLPHPHPLDTSQFLQHHSLEGAFTIGGATPRKEAGGWNPNTGRHGAQGAFHSSSSPEAPHPLGAGGPPGSGGCGPVQRGAGTQACGAGLIGRHISPSSVAPRQSIWEPRLQGCASSPGHQGLRGIESACSFCNLYFILVYK